MPRRPGVLLVSAVIIALFAGGARRRVVTPDPDLALDARRSFIVTDQAILDAFPFERVMNALVARSGTRTTAVHLYQQLFDTQNPRPGLVARDAPHCDDFTLDGRPAFNGLPRRCPTPEGVLANSDPFARGDHIPLALVNRFDLAAADGSNCGQYRIIFARKSNSRIDRLHFIFEAVLPNPDRAAGIAGCKAVAQFWADLSGIDSINERRARLDRFFFSGIAGFEPVINPTNYSAEVGGGIRTMHNTGALLGNRFYQFRLATRGADLVAEPDVLKNTPFGRFFDASYQTDLAKRFRDAFVANVRTLAIPDQDLFFADIPREFLLAESNPGESETDVVFEIPFLQSQFTAQGAVFAARINAELQKAGSHLSPLEIVTRAQRLSCAGCHFFRGNVQGQGDSFLGIEVYQHISESFTEPGEAGPRFVISRTMQEDFIPHRMEILRAFLSSGKAPVHSNAMIGGSRHD